MGLRKFRNKGSDEAPRLFTIIFQVKCISLVQAFKIKRIPIVCSIFFKRFLVLVENALDSMLSRINVL